MTKQSNWDTLKALDIFQAAYVECACWTENIPFCTNEELRAMRIDCVEFMAQGRLLLQDLDIAQCGHDFWLTRNGHGVGFWDRGYKDYISKGLTELSKSFGEFNIFGD